MITWKHTLNDVEIDEPIGFDGISLGPVRDDNYHGIGFEATDSGLTFTGNGYDILYAANEITGLKSNVIYAASSMCEGDTEFTNVLSGRVNFGTLKKSCGTSCQITASVESQSCEVVLNSRFDQNVDVDANTGIDTTTALNHYGEMGNRITLPAVKILAIDEAHNSADNSEVISDQPDWVITESGDTGDGHIAPRLDTNSSAALGAFNPISFTEAFQGGALNRPGTNFPITVDTTTLLGGLTCTFGDSTISFRVKGSADIVAPGQSAVALAIQVYKLPKGGDPASFDWVRLYNNEFNGGSTDVELIQPHVDFDVSGSVTTSVVQGDMFTFSIYYRSTRFGEIDKYTLTLDSETFFKMEAPTLCEDSDTQYYMIHETLSHVTEEITNGCLRVKSAYYGRLDSQPYEFPVDGCGGMRMVTSGLKIRNAANPTFFTSLKALIDGLKAIDNIGFDVYGNDMRVEDVAFFYRDKEIMRCPAVASVSISVDEGSHYAKITSGYKTWKVEKVNGLDEYNSEREFKTSLDTISTELNIQSELVAGSYPIEITRQQSFAATGAADTSYDNEVFIICLRRAMYPYSSYEVERGIITGPANMYSPETVYNWRIRPIANMMRWYKTIASSYRDFKSTVNKIFFSSGTGNIQAQGMTTDPACRPEIFSTIENQDLFFTQITDFKPLWINETVTYSYPMSLKEYQTIKTDPYGYISFQCGTGAWFKGYIKQIQYQPVAGMAAITLKRKYEG